MRPHGLLLALWYANTTCLARALNQSYGTTDFYKCDSSLYGRPNIQHCKTTLNTLPGIVPGPPIPKFTQSRKFVEPQFLEPPYKRVTQDYDGEIEQLPKIWSYRTCRMALMPLATPAGVVSPEAVTDWATVAEGALTGTRQCAGLRRSGGAMIITDSRYPGFVALYIYAAGSNFEEVVLNYMINSVPIVTGMDLGSGLGGDEDISAVNASARDFARIGFTNQVNQSALADF